MSEITVNAVDVARIKCEPGEVLLITVKGTLTADEAARVRDAFKRAFVEAGGHVPAILVVDDKIEARIVKAENDDPEGTQTVVFP